MVVFDMASEEFTSLLKENQKLKKQLEKYKKKLMIATKMEINEIDKNTFVGIDYFQHKCINYENQQKEFIKYLEDEIKSCELICDLIFNRNKEIKIYKEILQKYKEIIGCDKE